MTESDPTVRSLDRELRLTLKKLQGYESQGFLFHGGKTKLPMLEPRRARDNDTAKEVGNQNAVYADRSFRIPIVKALLDAKDKSLGSWQSGYSDDGRTTIVTGKNFTFTPGYVYVLPRNSFIEIDDERGGVEVVSYEPVQPIDAVQVTPALLKLLPEVIVQKE